MGRDTTKDFVRFLFLSRGSVYEILTQLEVAYDLAFINETEYIIIYSRYEGLLIGMNRHINSLRTY
jgi:four helix bundle protein